MSSVEKIHASWLPNKTCVLKDSLDITRQMVELISLDDPSERIIGLPAYHLKNIAQNVGRYTPSTLLFLIGCSEEHFIALCQRFDEDFINKERVRLPKSDSYYQKRIAQAIVQAIVRSDLDSNQAVAGMPDYWKKEISHEANYYTQGIKEFKGLKARDLFKPLATQS